jgi:hypothetical protein
MVGGGHQSMQVDLGGISSNIKYQYRMDDALARGRRSLLLLLVNKKKILPARGANRFALKKKNRFALPRNMLYRAPQLD